MQAYRPHSSQVDSVLVRGSFVYSGGDRRVLCSDFASGTVTSTVTRDSGNIPCLFEKDAELFICSTNGSIRTYALTHTGQNIKMVSKNVISVYDTDTEYSTVLFINILKRSLHLYCLHVLHICAADHNVGPLAIYHTCADGPAFLGGMRHARNRESHLYYVHLF